MTTPPSANDATMTNDETALTQTGPAPRLVTSLLAERWKLGAGKDLVKTLTLTVFESAKLTPSREEILAFCQVCHEHGLNPFLKQIYPLVKQGGGIITYVPIDGWIALANRHPQYSGFEFEEIVDGKGKLLGTKCRMFRKDWDHPGEATAWLAEVKKNTTPWTTMERRMCGHKAYIQCARYTLGLSLYDEDDARDAVRNADFEALPAKPGAAPTTLDDLAARMGGEGVPNTEPTDEELSALHAGLVAGREEADAATETPEASPAQEAVQEPQGDSTGPFEPADSAERQPALEYAMAWDSGMGKTYEPAFAVCCGHFMAWCKAPTPEGTKLAKRAPTWEDAVRGEKGGGRHALLMHAVNRAQETPPDLRTVDQERAACCLAMVSDGLPKQLGEPVAAGTELFE